MKFVFAAIVALVALVAISGFAAADRLPTQMPENQVFAIDTVVDVTGAVDDQTKLNWVISDKQQYTDDPTNHEGGSIPTGSLGRFQVIGDIAYKDSILTNGGKLAENKNFGFDSRNQGKGLYNIEAEKVLTYASTEGAHMVGEESLVLSVAGNWATQANTIRCVFSQNNGYLPAFCNIVSAKSSLVNVNSAQISTKGQIRGTAESAGIPAELNYRIAVTPDANSGSGFAEGTVSTVYTGSIMEARNADDYSNVGVTQTGASNPLLTPQNEPYYYNTWNKTSATNTWKDTASVTGGIKNFQHALSYQSGFRL